MTWVWLLKQNTNGYGVVVGVYGSYAGAEKALLRMREPRRLRHWIQREKVRA